MSEKIVSIPYGWRLLYLGEIVEEGDYMINPESDFEITKEAIGQRARQIWEESGKQEGRDELNWSCAEQELIDLYCVPHRQMIGQREWAGGISIRRKDSWLMQGGTQRVKVEIKKSTREKVSEYLKKCLTN